MNRLRVPLSLALLGSVLLYACSKSSGTAPVGSSGGAGTCDTVSAAHAFGSSMFFNRSVASAGVWSYSSEIISQLVTNGGWGNGNKLQIDEGIDVYYPNQNYYASPGASSSDNTPSIASFVPLSGFALPDSDQPATIPIPPNADGMGYEGGASNCSGGDCHYLVVDCANGQETDVFEASNSGGSLQSPGGLAIWPFAKAWPASLRGYVCTSADAGGFPIAPMLFTAEEIAAGQINHAIRFILPNNRIQCQSLVQPASHFTGPDGCSASGGWETGNFSDGGPKGVPYGAWFRLKSSFDISHLSAGGQVVAKALQTYGMILADGGNIALTAKSDQYSTAKYGSTLGTNDLDSTGTSRRLKPADGPRVKSALTRFIADT